MHLYKSSRSSLLNLDLICKQIRLTLLCLIERDHREKNYVPVIHVCGYEILVLFIVLEIFVFYL